MSCEIPGGGIEPEGSGGVQNPLPPVETDSAEQIAKDIFDKTGIDINSPTKTT